MIKGIINEISYLLGVDSFWIFLILVLWLLLKIVKCIYPWEPEMKAKKTKDKHGNEITVFYKLDK